MTKHQRQSIVRYITLEGKTSCIELRVVKVKGDFSWAVQLVVEGISRYRVFHFKREATKDYKTWLNEYTCDVFSLSKLAKKEYNDNFHSAEQLGIKEVK